LANHRNKMIHFFHADVDGDDQAKAQIVAEHCRSWFHLHRLLNRWDTYFGDFGAEIADADRSMKKHRKYLSAKFKELKPVQDASRKAGSKPIACSACGFKAAVSEELNAQIASLQCLVCDHAETQVEIDCPHCNQVVVITGEGYAKCVHCGGAIEPEHLVAALSKDVVGTKDYFETGLPANCGNCDGYHTVIACGDGHFCANCFDICDRVEQCGWCSELCTGDMESSYSNGCGQCEGQWGHVKDD
jgi:histone H3/H4